MIEIQTDTLNFILITAAVYIAYVLAVKNNDLCISFLSFNTYSLRCIDR